MLVATFGPGSAWHGREIIWDVDHFILVGHGGIPAAGLLDYDRLGQIVWARPEYRGWARQVDGWERGVASRTPGVAPAGGASFAPAGAGSSAGAPPRPRFPAWAIVVLVVAALALLLAVVVVAVVPSLVSRAADSFGGDLVVRDGLHSIQSGIESYALQHNGQYPAPGEVNEVGLSRYIAPWPQNPYTGLPMADGGGAGNYRYDLSGDGGAYRLIGYGRDGGELLRLSGGSTDTV